MDRGKKKNYVHYWCQMSRLFKWHVEQLTCHMWLVLYFPCSHWPSCWWRKEVELRSLLMPNEEILQLPCWRIDLSYMTSAICPLFSLASQLMEERSRTTFTVHAKCGNSSDSSTAMLKNLPVTCDLCCLPFFSLTSLLMSTKPLY